MTMGYCMIWWKYIHCVIYLNLSIDSSPNIHYIFLRHNYQLKSYRPSLMNFMDTYVMLWWCPSYFLSRVFIFSSVLPQYSSWSLIIPLYFEVTFKNSFCMWERPWDIFNDVLDSLHFFLLHTFSCTPQGFWWLNNGLWCIYILYSFFCG